MFNLHRTLTTVALLTGALLLLAGCGGQSAATSISSSASSGAGEQKVLHVSAAASLTNVMQDIAADYEKQHPDVKVEFNFGSSGALQQAIENGGNADVFVSAAQKQMNALEKAGLLADGTRADLLVNDVVLIVPKDSKKNIATFEDLKGSAVQHLALGEPKGVPVGQYSEEIFTKMNMLDAMKGPRLGRGWRGRRRSRLRHGRGHQRRCKGRRQGSGRHAQADHLSGRSPQRLQADGPREGLHAVSPQ